MSKKKQNVSKRERIDSLEREVGKLNKQIKLLLSQQQRLIEVVATLSTSMPHDLESMAIKRLQRAEPAQRKGAPPVLKLPLETKRLMPKQAEIAS